MTVHQLIRVLKSDDKSTAADLVAKFGIWSDMARKLAYRLYMICDRKKRLVEALAYNKLIQSWPEIMRFAQDNDKLKFIELIS